MWLATTARYEAKRGRGGGRVEKGVKRVAKGVVEEDKGEEGHRARL